MPTEIVVPELGESIVEATVSRWLKQEGDKVSTGEAIVELETEKVNLEVSAEQAGTLTAIKRQTGEDVKIGDVLGEIEPGQTGSAQKSSVPEEDQSENQESEPAEPEKESSRATPVAQRLADEKNVNLQAVSGSGKDSRITRQDVETWLEEQKSGPKTDSVETESKSASETGNDKDAGPEKTTAATERQKPKPATSRKDPDRPEERVKMSRRRQTIARRLVEAQQTAAMLTTFNEINLGPVMDLRARRKEGFQDRHGVKLGIVSFFIKAAIGALKIFPDLNAEIEDKHIIYKHYYDIGVAIGAEDGLVVPVLRNADQMSFAGIEQAIKTFANQAAESTLSLADLQGGTFTITNGGVFGSLLSTPILNPPQVAILGLHKIEKRPVVVNDEVKVQPMMYVALSYDHRIVDGREAVQFLVRIKTLIEDPEILLLEG